MCAPRNFREKGSEERVVGRSRRERNNHRHGQHRNIGALAHLGCLGDSSEYGRSTRDPAFADVPREVDLSSARRRMSTEKAATCRQRGVTRRNGKYGTRPGTIRNADRAAGGFFPRNRAQLSQTRRRAGSSRAAAELLLTGPAASSQTTTYACFQGTYGGVR